MGSPDELTVRPIVDEDLPGVARFLASNMPSATPVNEWVAAWTAANNRPGSEAPNHGMLLLAGEEIVGEYAAIYSVRRIAGKTERFCNLAVWCVLPEYRTGSWRLVRALLAQKGYHFTDLDPSEVVQQLNLRMGFTYLETRTQLAANLPWRRHATARVSSDPEVIARSLGGSDVAEYRDHEFSKWARHIAITRGGRSCYVQWRVVRIKGRDWLAEVQYVSDRELFRSAFPDVSRHLLTRHGMRFTAVEERVSGGKIPHTWSRQKKVRKMFKSETLRPEHIDYLYSEITAQP